MTNTKRVFGNHCVNDLLEDIQNRFWNLKYLKYVTNILCSFFICVGIKWLTDYDSEIYQAYKDAALAKAIMAFLALLFIVRKVKPLNLSSLVATVIVAIGGHYYIQEMINSPDVLLSRKPWIVNAWLIVIILIDAFRYHKFEQIKINKPLAVMLFWGTTFWMLKNSNGSSEGTVMLVVFGLLFTTPLTHMEWQNLVKRLCDGWFCVSVWLIAKSLIYYYPYETERFYGCFLNIGPFGIFLLCSLIISIYGIYYLTEKKDLEENERPQKILKYFMLCVDLVWLAVILRVSMMTRTFTMFIGLLLVLMALFLVGRRNTDKRHMMLRIRIIICFMLMCGVILTYVFMNAQELSVYLRELWLEQPNNTIVYYAYRVVNSFSTGTEAAYLTKTGLSPFWGVLDMLSSQRVYIWKQFIEAFNFTGNISAGIDIELFDYFATNAHCEYIQTIYRFGYIGGLMNIALFVYGTICSVKEYLITKDKPLLLAIMWLVGMFGTWMGEMSNIIYPVTFTGLLLLYPIFVKLRNE